LKKHELVMYLVAFLYMIGVVIYFIIQNKNDVFWEVVLYVQASISFLMCCFLSIGLFYKQKGIRDKE